jgi:nicotinic acid mononucleotide adenylyltransferase
MSSRYDNDSEDVVQENKKQTEAINKYIIGTLKMYINPEIFVKNPSGNTKKRKMPSIYYTRQYTKTPGEVQKIQKEVTNEQAANKLASGSGSGSGASGASGTSGITTGTGMGQPMQQQFQQPQLQQFQQPQLQQPQQQLVPQPVKVMGGGAEPIYGMGGVSGLNVQATSISSRVDQNAEPYIASLIKFSNAGFPPYSTLKSQVDTFFNLRAFRGFLKKLGNPVTIRDTSNQPINVEKALGPILDSKGNKVVISNVESEFRNIFGPVTREKTSEPSLKEYINDKIKGTKIRFWSTSEKPQKIGRTFIFLYSIPSPQESRQQAQLSGTGRNTNANRPMMLMVKDGNDYSLIGGYVDNTTKNIIGNTQVSIETETEVTKSDTIYNTIRKEFSLKTGMSNFPPNLATKYLLYTPPHEKDGVEINEVKIQGDYDREILKKNKLNTEINNLKQKIKDIKYSIDETQQNTSLERADKLQILSSYTAELEEDQKNLENKEDSLRTSVAEIDLYKKQLDDIKKDKDILPVIVYAVQISQNNMQTIIQSSKSRTTLASGELVMVPIVTIYNVLGGKQISDNIVISNFQNRLLQMTIGILQQEKIISQIADASQIGTDYYDDKKRMEALQKILSPDSISEIDDIIKHNIKFILGIFFSYKNSFNYSGNQYIINSVDWNDAFKQLSSKSKLLKRMNASYYISLKLFLEKLEPGKLPSDRKGTFLESCGVKGAIIRNEWKNNFESKTLKEWKALLPLPTFGKGKGEGILNKIVPSFIKNALKSIQNPLMSPLDPGVLQVSLIQYSLLGEVELQEFYFKIENSFAGVAWKNDNTWEKRKQRLFAAMDECQADIYCFQNVQCSLDVYKNCVKKAVSDYDDNEKEKKIEMLRNINELSTYRERLNFYFSKIHENLISTHDSEGLNCISDIYEKYKDSYDFVYFFEQVFYTSGDLQNNTDLSSIGSPNMLYPEYGKKVALGNLTMVKKSKFEIENKLRYDVRIGAAFCSENIKKKFDSNFKDFSSTLPNFKDEYDSMCRNKSFASMVYIRFKPVAEVPPVELELNQQPTNDEQVENAMSSENREFENDETLKEVVESNNDEEVIENAEGEEDKTAEKDEMIEQGGGAPTWYDKDTTEVVGYGRVIKKPPPPPSKKKSSKSGPPLPCFDMKDTLYIPKSNFTSNPLYGICNIKFDTTDISQKSGSSSLPKDVMQLVLMAVFIYKLRFNMQSYGLRITNLYNNPFIVSGLFRDDMVTGSDGNPKLKSALKLLTTDITTKWKQDISGPFDDYVNNFVKSMIILTYLRVGKIRVAGYHSIHRNFNPKLVGDTYPLEQRSGSSISELIICCDNFKICNTDPNSDNAMHKMIPARNPNPNFPLFPNNANPSNSVAIGGVFDITTPAIRNHVDQVKASIEQQKLADETAVKNAQLASVPYEGEKMSLDELQKMFPVPVQAPASTLSTSIVPSSMALPIVSSSAAPAPAAAPAAAPAPNLIPPLKPSTATTLISENSLVKDTYLKEFLNLGVPRGYVVVSQDRYNFFKQSDDKTKMEEYTIDSLKLEDFTFSETTKYVHSVFAGSFLFYYDFKKVGGIDYYKVWFPFNGSSAFSGLIDKNNYNDVFKINTFNPQGNGGMIMWLPVPMISIHPFIPKEQSEIQKIIDECRKNPDKIYKDAVITIMINFFNIYTAGNNVLSPKLKNFIKEIFLKLQIKLPHEFDSYPNIYKEPNITPKRTLAINKIIEDLEKLAKGETPAPAPVLAAAPASAPALGPKPVPTSAPAPAPATTLKVMSFNTWFAAFSPKDHKNDDDTRYCNNFGINPENPCKKNIMDEIMRQIEQGTQVIFLQEFVRTDQIRSTFTGYPVSFTDTSQRPFVMTYTPKPPSLSQPDEYYVYSFKAGSANGNGETATTLCSKRFFSSPPSDYFMGNLTSVPNTPLHALNGDTTTPSQWIVSGGSRPYIVLVFKDKKMILINIHAPHYNKKFEILLYHTPIQIQEVNKQNTKYNNNLMTYAITELGIMLRKRIPTELKEYSIVFGGDFNCGPDRAQEYLAMLGENGKEGVFSNSSGQFKTLATNPSPSDKQKSPTCCVTKSESPGFTSAFDQIYSNKLNIVNYWAYGQKKLQKPKPPIGNLNYFSDHLPVYAEIEIPAVAPITAPAPAPITSTSITTSTTTTSSPSGVSQVRELSVDQINSEISNPSNNSIYIINGGSFNPPHFGHIGLFELAYQAIQKDTNIPKIAGQKYYGVMVLAPEKHISDKLIKANGNTTGLLSLKARVNLCQLTIVDYQWKDPSRFGPQNMIVVNEEEYNPMGSIISRNPSKIQNMYYLCGSDFYFDQINSEGKIEKRGHYGANMNMVYSIRESSLDKTPDPYKGTFKHLRITESRYKDMSSTKVRQNILTLEGKAGFNSSTTQEIIANIGKGSYCYLGSMPYLIPKNDYHLQKMGCPEAQGGGGSNGIVEYTNKRHTLKKSKLKSRKIKKHASTSISTPTTRFTKKHFHLKHSHNKKHKTRRNKN